LDITNVACQTQVGFAVHISQPQYPPNCPKPTGTIEIRLSTDVCDLETGVTAVICYTVRVACRDNIDCRHKDPKRYPNPFLGTFNQQGVRWIEDFVVLQNRSNAIALVTAYEVAIPRMKGE
jgi:hypothetical protein